MASWIVPASVALAAGSIPEVAVEMLASLLSTAVSKDIFTMRC